MTDELPPIANTRILSTHTTGVQRYLMELLTRWGDKVGTIAPRGALHGVAGHAWEQIVLPSRLGGRVLFSPSNTGPLAVRKQVVTLHDVVPLDHPEWLNPRFAAWYAFLTPRLARRVAHIITISEFTRQRIVDRIGLPEERITVIPNGVDERFQPHSEDKIHEATQALGLPSRHYILCVGSVEPRKNLSRLLGAWRIAMREIPDDVWLVLVGSQSNRRIFAEQGDNSMPRRVYMTGHLADKWLPPLYAGAIAFAYPSVYEGFGLPPLEAMASGVPVLTSNTTALPEVIGEAGYMVDPEDIEAIAEGLLALADDEALRARMAAAGITRAGLFSWSDTAAKTLAVFKQVANTT